MVSYPQVYFNLSMGIHGEPFDIHEKKILVFDALTSRVAYMKKKQRFGLATPEIDYIEGQIYPQCQMGFTESTLACIRQWFSGKAVEEKLCVLSSDAIRIQHDNNTADQCCFMLSGVHSEWQIYIGMVNRPVYTAEEIRPYFPMCYDIAASIGLTVIFTVGDAYSSNLTLISEVQHGDLNLDEARHIYWGIDLAHMFATLSRAFSTKNSVRYDSVDVNFDHVNLERFNLQHHTSFFQSNYFYDTFDMEKYTELFNVRVAMNLTYMQRVAEQQDQGQQVQGQQVQQQQLIASLRATRKYLENMIAFSKLFTEDNNSTAEEKEIRLACVYRFLRKIDVSHVQHYIRTIQTIRLMLREVGDMKIMRLTTHSNIEKFFYNIRKHCQGKPTFRTLKYAKARQDAVIEYVDWDMEMYWNEFMFLR
ncbi:uncharacterized protein [Musca autumnalis]|uniref:uncharacterized protein n=1 Tax=Musca autumnalis TaxID=221902 RepID=UPI003CFA0C17